jgi:hypothetical protein
LPLWARGLAYQWYLKSPTDANWRRITESTPSAQTATLVIPGRVTYNGYTFRCIVSNDAGRVISDTVGLTFAYIPAEPVITAQPADAETPLGTAAAFTVEAEGEDLQYQWYLKSPTDAAWRRITASTPSATTPTLVIPGKASLSGYTFRCIVSNGGGRAISETVTLTVYEVFVN